MSRIDSGQAEVFPVRGAEGSAVFALKRLKNPKRAPRFSREVETMRRLHGAGLSVPAIVDSGEVGGHAFFVMPWFEQGSLEHRVRERAYATELPSGIYVLSGLQTTLRRAEMLGRELIAPGISLFEECADHLAAGRAVRDPQTWKLSEQGSYGV